MNKETMSSKPIILCVDDEKMILDSLNRQLQRSFKDKYDFEFAESAEEALEILNDLNSQGYEVVMVISDQIMPGMAGDQFLIQLHEKFPEQIKIMLTGQASLESAVNVINKADLYRYITKPWNEEDFILTVGKGLEKYSLSDQVYKQIEVFSRYVPKQFLESLSKSSILDIRLGDHVEKEMTILFSDIRNFTTISEFLSAEETYKFINDYLGYIEPAIVRHNGFIDKFVGDAVMALFFNVEDAFLASLEIQQSLNKFNQDFKDEKFHPIVSGIGLHTGNLMLGIVGVESRLQSTVISDAVNIASRLQDITKMGGLIIASGEFINKLRESAKDKYDELLRFLGRIKVKGKKQVVQVYEIISNENDSQSHHKLSTKSTMDEGLKLFFNKSFAESCVKFKTVLTENPEDKFVQMYLNFAAKYMLEGVPDDWDGVYIVEGVPSIMTKR